MQSVQLGRRGKWLIFCLILLAVIFCYRLGLYLAESSGPDAETNSAEPGAVSAPPQEMARRGESPETWPVLPPEAEGGEAQVDAELVAEAVGWLRDGDPAKRLDGVQQLGAYATAEAEKELVRTLRTDADVEVRIAAADSLSHFDAPSDDTWEALLHAVSDKEQDVQIAALAALQVLAAQTDDVSTIGRLRESLEKKALSRHMSFESRDAIQDLLDQLQP